MPLSARDVPERGYTAHPFLAGDVAVKGCVSMDPDFSGVPWVVLGCFSFLSYLRLYYVIFTYIYHFLWNNSVKESRRMENTLRANASS